MSNNKTEINLLANCSSTSLNKNLKWINEPAHWNFDEKGLHIVPQPKTDFFRPYNGPQVDNACLLYTNVKGDFTACSSMSVVLAGFGDAAALTVRSDSNNWFKICIERSPVGDISIVSVITNGWSDDSNGELLSQPAATLRITRKGDTFGMNYRTENGNWRFVRAFSFKLPEEVMVGVHAQAPFQAGCSASISSFTLSSIPVDDVRSGEYLK